VLARGTAALVTHRVRFEQRVLGVATAERFHFEESVAELPKVGDLAGPMHSKAAWRCVTRVERAPAAWNLAALVKLEDIDCTYLERDFDAEVAALREQGWAR